MCAFRTFSFFTIIIILLRELRINTREIPCVSPVVQRNAYKNHNQTSKFSHNRASKIYRYFWRRIFGTTVRQFQNRPILFLTYNCHQILYIGTIYLCFYYDAYQRQTRYKAKSVYGRSRSEIVMTRLCNLRNRFQKWWIPNYFLDNFPRRNKKTIFFFFFLAPIFWEKTGRKFLSGQFIERKCWKNYFGTIFLRENIENIHSGQFFERKRGKMYFSGRLFEKKTRE